MKRDTNIVNINIGRDDLVISCIDLFCGLGGLTHGLSRGGVQVVAGIDIDPQCLFPYEINNDAKFFEQDVSKLSGTELADLFGDSKLRLLAGCAPCQPFSKYSSKGRIERKDTKWSLVAEFGRLIQETRPELVTMENVPQLLEHQVFEGFLIALKGYSSWWSVVDCSQYGVPQTRKRLVLLASRLGPIQLTAPDSRNQRRMTVRDAISHLPTLSAGCSHANDPMHTSCSLSDINMKRIKESKPGGTWRDWSASLIAECHRKDSGQTFPSVYGRMAWDAPAPTITTQCFGFGNGRFGHPEQDRAISLREAAILQTFPPDYQFVPPGARIRFSNLGRLIGNAVPVQIGKVIAQSLIEHANAYYR